MLTITKSCQGEEALHLHSLSNMEEELPFKVEYAKSGRASCRGCKQNIGKDTLRLAVMVQVKAITLVLPGNTRGRQDKGGGGGHASRHYLPPFPHH